MIKNGGAINVAFPNDTNDSELGKWGINIAFLRGYHTSYHEGDGKVFLRLIMKNTSILYFVLTTKSV